MCTRVAMLSIMYALIHFSAAATNPYLVSSASLGGAAKGLDAVSASITIVESLLKMPGICCPPIFHGKDGPYCADGSNAYTWAGSPYCAYGSCNFGGCNCGGGCKVLPTKAEPKVIVYEGRGFNEHGRGADQVITLPSSSRCINFNFYDDKISSIALINTCVKIYEHRNCLGVSKCICEQVQNLQLHEMRDGINWNDEISSMSTCDRDSNSSDDVRVQTSARGKECHSQCAKQGNKYYWCKTATSWDYCSLQGKDHYGNTCDNACGYYGYSYQWCSITIQFYKLITERTTGLRSKKSWGYCST